jgi:hypothetical protein
MALTLTLTLTLTINLTLTLTLTLLPLIPAPSYPTPNPCTHRHAGAPCRDGRRRVHEEGGHVVPAVEHQRVLHGHDAPQERAAHVRKGDLQGAQAPFFIPILPMVALGSMAVNSMFKFQGNFLASVIHMSQVLWTVWLARSAPYLPHEMAPREKNYLDGAQSSSKVAVLSHHIVQPFGRGKSAEGWRQHEGSVDNSRASIHAMHVGIHRRDKCGRFVSCNCSQRISPSAHLGTCR